MEVAHYLPHHHLQALERLMAEYHEHESHEIEGKKHSGILAEALGHIMLVVVQHLEVQGALQAKKHAVNATPQNEVETGAMPQAAEQHGGQQIDVGAHLALTVSAEGDVHIIAYPRRQRDVPAVPEFAYAGAQIGRAEVVGEVKAQQQGQTDGHIAVATEVAVYLKSISIHTRQVFYARVEGGIVEHTVYEVQTDIIADDGLLDESDDDEVYTPRHHRGADVRRSPDLRYEIGRPHDGAGHQLGEERHVEGIV